MARVNTLRCAEFNRPINLFAFEASRAGRRHEHCTAAYAATLVHPLPPDIYALARPSVRAHVMALNMRNRVREHRNDSAI
jgi:hypothetical protein